MQALLLEFPAVFSAPTLRTEWNLFGALRDLVMARIDRLARAADVANVLDTHTTKLAAKPTAKAAAARRPRRKPRRKLSLWRLFDNLKHLT